MFTENKQVLTVEEFNKRFPVDTPVTHKGVQLETEFMTIVQKPAFRAEDGLCYFVNSRRKNIRLSEIILEN